MMRFHLVRLGLLAALVGTAPLPAQAKPDFRGLPDFPISSSVATPEHKGLVYVSGTVPGVADDKAPAGSVARFGDTETQTRSVLTRIAAELEKHGLGLGDVVMMRVFLVAPPGAKAMDFAGMMRGYSAFFGTAEQPGKPARSTMQVAGLVDPGWLVEIEVTASKR